MLSSQKNRCKLFINRELIREILTLMMKVSYWLWIEKDIFKSTQALLEIKFITCFQEQSYSSPYLLSKFTFRLDVTLVHLAINAVALQPHEEAYGDSHFSICVEAFWVRPGTTHVVLFVGLSIFLENVTYYPWREDTPYEKHQLLQWHLKEWCLHMGCAGLPTEPSDDNIQLDWRQHVELKTQHKKVR